jgi:hypothetical protein
MYAKELIEVRFIYPYTWRCKVTGRKDTIELSPQ